MKMFQLVFGLILACCSTLLFAQAIDINTASTGQLDKAIKGIGPARANTIVKYREANGPFKSVDDLLKVEWTKDKALSKILKDNKEMLTVGGTAPTATAPAVPAAPTVPTVPAVQATPTVPAVPKVPAVPAVPKVPAVPAVPAAPAVPAK